MNKNCDSCIGETTTSMCFNCDVARVKSKIDEIQEFIKLISDLNRFKFCFNERYGEYIKNALKLDLIDYTFTNLLPDNTVCTIIDLKELDWGDYLVE